jgi:hydrogenase nickel incorporation protein HypB
MILNKIDLLPYVPFKADIAKENARKVHPGMEIIDVSCVTGEGMQSWMEWLQKKRKSIPTKVVASVS